MNQYDGVEANLDDIAKQQEEDKKKAQADSRWRSIEDGKTAQMQWTGKVYRREASYEGNLMQKIGAELVEKNPKGESRVFEVGAKSSAARDMIRIIRKAKAENKLPVTVFVKRKGMGAATRYEISEAE